MTDICNTTQQHTADVTLTHSSYAMERESSASSKVCLITPHKASDVLKQEYYMIHIITIATVHLTLT